MAMAPSGGTRFSSFCRGISQSEASQVCLESLSSLRTLHLNVYLAPSDTRSPEHALILSFTRPGRAHPPNWVNFPRVLATKVAVDLIVVGQNSGILSRNVFEKKLVSSFSGDVEVADTLPLRELRRFCPTIQRMLLKSGKAQAK